MSDWIKCEEKLPPVNKRVLIYAIHRLDNSPLITITKMSDVNIINTNLKTTPYWVNPFQYFTSNYTITHWMPLPDAPKHDIRVGDEVCYIEREENVFVVTYIYHSQEYCDGIRSNGEVVKDSTIKLLKKTGRHFDVYNLLSAMNQGETEDE